MDLLIYPSIIPVLKPKYYILQSTSSAFTLLYPNWHCVNQHLGGDNLLALLIFLFEWKSNSHQKSVRHILLIHEQILNIQLADWLDWKISEFPHQTKAHVVHWNVTSNTWLSMAIIYLLLLVFQYKDITTHIAKLQDEIISLRVQSYPWNTIWSLKW